MEQQLKGSNKKERLSLQEIIGGLIWYFWLIVIVLLFAGFMYFVLFTLTHNNQTPRGLEVNTFCQEHGYDKGYQDNFFGFKCERIENETMIRVPVELGEDNKYYFVEELK